MKIKRFAFLFMLWAIACFAYNQEPQWKWVRTTSKAPLVSSATDSLGNVVAVGIFGEPVMYFGTTMVEGSSLGEASNMYIVKYNSAGGLLWAQSLFGTNSGSEIAPVKVVANDNGMIAVICRTTEKKEKKRGGIWKR